MINFPYVVTISSEKGGVGKTTLATNLAVFLKALDEDMPVSIFSFDNHFTIDKMFEIKGQPVRANISDFLAGAPGHELLHTGQYGVNYIPSSKELGQLKGTLSGSLLLAKLLANSEIPGIVIIDTRPDLDILTQNALFAADRAFIPVKDMASLENCRNIFDLFDSRGFDKKSLALVPCIIDSRIKFDGPFQDQRSLLKGYAINRGYRCLDTFISKSPKVESLATNPSGKVLPIFNYARNTEVFAQFTQLARTVLDAYNAAPSPRAKHFHDWLLQEEERGHQAFVGRRESIRDDCVLCSRPFAIGNSYGYYFESSDSVTRGFLEEPCFSDILLQLILKVDTSLAHDDPQRLMLRDAFNGSSLALRTSYTGSIPTVELSKFDHRGEQLLKQSYPLPNHGSGVAKFLKAGFLEGGGAGEKGFLLIHPVSKELPEEILKEENYRVFKKLKQKITVQMV